jgi:hypothetical protein
VFSLVILRTTRGTGVLISPQTSSSYLIMSYLTNPLFLLLNSAQHLLRPPLIFWTQMILMRHLQLATPFLQVHVHLFQDMPHLLLPLISLRLLPAAGSDRCCLLPASLASLLLPLIHLRSLPAAGLV